ncbi:hypothetical protein [Acinetobacter junii]|uniref:hypothetical protein n=1 Tax=Acinetobacter junii TaxID=40215 RepID=UPI00124FC315|nr:hypothetical protein [Acinetobacter junii]
MKQQYFVNRFDSINPIYLENLTKKWVQCRYCGRTVMYSQRTRHTTVFHTNSTGGLIIDF